MTVTAKGPTASAPKMGSGRPPFRQLLFSLCQLLLLAVLLPVAVAAATGNGGNRTIDRLLVNGGLLLTRDDAIICSRNPDRPLVPASTWKLTTALAALYRLGPEYRFETHLFVDRSHTLFIQGLGDPLLISEEVGQIMAELAQSGVKTINDIVVDDSSFALDANADGAGISLNPYDVANGALAVNFNTVNIRVEEDGSVHSAEPQTPTLPLMTRLAQGLAPGEHRINIGHDRQRIITHVGELFRAMQQHQGISGTGRIRAGHPPAGLTPVIRHRSSKPLRELVEAMLRYSNNFIANQLFLTLGAKESGYPATWAKGRAALSRFLLGDLGLPPETIRIEEGSGLSRHNRITPRAMLSVLRAFKPYSHLLPLEDGIRIKSGTLTGVYAYAGYLPNADGLDSFVLILNQTDNNRNRLLRELVTIHGRRP